MNITLLMSALLCSLGIDAPVQGPRLVINASDQGPQLILEGPPAKALFEHLQHPLVEVIDQDLEQKRRGYAIECSRTFRFDGFHYSCVETLADGRTIALLPFQRAMKDEPQLLYLTMTGPELEVLYHSMSTEAHPQSLSEGVIEHKKISSNLTCTETVDFNQNSSSYACEQILSEAGYSWGTGTAPMIGAGTRPRQVEANNDL